MSKAERIAIEARARDALARKLGCAVERKRVSFPNDGPVHEFDLFAAGRVIGGVTTSPLSTSLGSRNTGGCDRACSELLWLSLWSGPEQCIHVLTDRSLADWLVTRFQRLPFPHEITIFHYDPTQDALSTAGTINA
jgi:hypothetical protein